LIILCCLPRVILIASSYTKPKKEVACPRNAHIHSHISWPEMAFLPYYYMCHSSNIQTHSFPRLSSQHITLCHHYDTWPATTWGHYYYIHVTSALRNHILGHLDAVRKFIQSVLWFLAIICVLNLLDLQLISFMLACMIFQEGPSRFPYFIQPWFVYAAHVYMFNILNCTRYIYIFVVISSTSYLI